jgi:energy-converting hydrogenase Eha subunit B
MMRLGVGVAFSMVVVAIGLSIARRAFLGAITEGLPRPVASSFFDAVSESMRTGFRGTFVFGLVAALLVLVASRHDFADRWARPTQITVGALGVLAILAREEPNGAYVIFMAVITVMAIAALEAVKQRGLRGPVAPEPAQ